MDANNSAPRGALIVASWEKCYDCADAIGRKSDGEILVRGIAVESIPSGKRRFPGSSPRDWDVRQNPAAYRLSEETASMRSLHTHFEKKEMAVCSRERVPESLRPTFS